VKTGIIVDSLAYRGPCPAKYGLGLQQERNSVVSIVYFHILVSK